MKLNSNFSLLGMLLIFFSSSILAMEDPAISGMETALAQLEDKLTLVNRLAGELPTQIANQQSAIELQRMMSEDVSDLETALAQLEDKLTLVNRLAGELPTQIANQQSAIELQRMMVPTPGPVTPPTPVAAGPGYSVDQLTNMWQAAYNYFANTFAAGSDPNFAADQIYTDVEAVVAGTTNDSTRSIYNAIQDTTGIHVESGIAIGDANRQQAEAIKMIVDAGIDSLAGRGINIATITNLVGAPDDSNLRGSFRDLMDQVIGRLKTLS